MKLLSLLFPPKCVACGDLLFEGELKLCPACREGWKSVQRKKCYVCQKTAKNCDCRPRHISSTDKIGERHISSLVFFAPAKNASETEQVIRNLIYNLKREKNTDLQEFFAEELAHTIIKLIEENDLDKGDFVITYPPRSFSGVVKNGFDHMKKLCRVVSEYTGIPLESPLINKSRRQQKLLSVFKRLENANRAYKLKRGKYVQNKTYILIDDVITSGATVEAISKLLKASGAAAVYPLAIAKPKYKNRKKISGTLYWKTPKHS